MDPKTLDHIRVYEMYRRRIVEEDDLINNRMTWLILSEAFLFAAFGAMLVKLEEEPIIVIMTIVVLLGIYIAYLSQKAISAARKEIESLDAHYKKNNIDVVRDYRILKLIGEEGRHEIGHRLPNQLPIIIIYLWIAILASPIIGNVSIIRNIISLVRSYFSS